MKKNDMLLIAAALVAVVLIMRRPMAAGVPDLVNDRLISSAGAGANGVVGGQRYIDQHRVNDDEAEYVFGGQRYFDQHRVNDEQY